MSADKEKKDEQKPVEGKYEDLIKRFENIVSKLEEGELELEQAILLYEEGMKLQKSLEGILHQAEQKIEKLIKNDAGTTRKPFKPNPNN